MSPLSPLRYLEHARVRRARRYWQTGLALAALVTLLAAAQFALAPRHYTATQDLRVVVLAVPGAPATDAAALSASLARDLSSSSTLSTPALATAILARIADDEQARQHVTLASIESALSATHRGSIVSLSATWTSAQVAQDMLAAAVAALQSQPRAAQDTTPPQATQATVRLQANAAASAATRTPSEESSLLALLLGRFVLGLLAGALLPFALALAMPSTLVEPIPAAGS
jgi:hypothetical protein